MEYNFKDIEQKWQRYWKEHGSYKTGIRPDRPKYYVLDMFPYPSGAGLHVGHPLGYIASDIYSRYKRLKGFNVLHPMGYDAYGLPAEQYAIQTGQHPAITTEQNIRRYREQLDKIGFSFDWSREVRTSDPAYYKWTQWAFIQMFNSYYCHDRQQARPIAELVQRFEAQGSAGLNVACTEERSFSAAEWKAMTEREQQETLMNYRIAYLADTMVNWCPQLGTVLANDEVVNGVSERGGYPVEQRKMRQWCLRVSAYAQRLLDGLETIDWTDSLKETQRNWIGRSEGAEMRFKIKGSDVEMNIFTTRADTVFGVTFMVLAPESDYVDALTTPEQRPAVQAYLEATKKRTERERQADKKVSGVFTGSYAINPLSGQEIPVWVSDYVLAGYGTGAIMAVPAHDSRDYAFARHFNLPIIPLIEGCDVSEESFDAKEGIMMNSGFLNGLTVPEAIRRAKEYVREQLGRAFPGILQGRYALHAARSVPARRAARSHQIPAHRHGRASAGTRHPLGMERKGTEDCGHKRNRPRERVPPRAEHHAGFRRLVGVLHTLHGPAQRPRPGEPRSRRVLAQRRPVHRRHGTRHRAPHLQPLLEQVPFRPRPRVRRRAFQEAHQPRHDTGAEQLRVPHQRHEHLRVARTQGSVLLFKTL